MKWLGAVALMAVWGISVVAHADAGPPGDAAVPDVGEPGCGTVDALGECRGDTLRQCVGDRVVETHCPTRHGTGFTCQLTEGLGAAQCVYRGTDAGPGSTREPTPEEPEPLPAGGCGCIRPSTADGAMALGFFWLIRPRRRP
ncbi:MAG: hypothetical protein AB2A00_11355 [Myxococcota bacterium]